MRHYLYRHIRLDKNEPFYIGIGTKELLRQNLKPTCSYRRAYEKKGRGNIWNKIVKKTEYDIEILFESNDYELVKEKEKEFILLYGRINLNTGTLANLTDGGDGTLGIISSKESIEKRKLSRSETIKKRGYFHSSESIKAITSHLINRPCSKETRNKIGSKAKERGLDGIQKAIDSRKRKVSKYDLQNNYICTYNTIIEAEAKCKVNKSNIQMVCKGIRKTAGGFIWKYEIGSPISYENQLKNKNKKHEK